MNTENRIEFNFTYFALKALGNSLYSNPWVAVSELVANGLDAGAKNVNILIDIRNKEHSTIEIMDNGSGMSYDDIANKYAIIGRNRRLENPNEIKFGRKGVGKLAALYLTPHYFIFTKNNNKETAWEIDTSLFKDSDIPTLKRVEPNNDIITIGKYWEDLQHGTLIKLVDVNLNAIGEKKLESLKAILADFYLSEIYGNAISVAILKKHDDSIKFENIQKNIFFDTFYGMFDTTGKFIKKMKPAVYLTDADEVYPEIDYPRKTVEIKSELPYCGTMRMQDVNGNELTIPYSLVGWIGINCSLKTEIQKRNSPSYVNFPYRGNELRVYVNGKLAISDMIRLLGLTQVNVNYIEGELSFDVLDRNDLEDSATSSRESYKTSDPRMQKLISIISPIVKKLITARSNIGTIINKQQIELNAAKEKQLKTEKENAQIIEAALKKVESEKKEVEKQNAVANKRLFVLERNFIGSGENYKNGMHLAVNYAKAIKSTSIRMSRNSSARDVNHLIDIAGYAENIIRLNKLLGKAKFSLESPEIKEDLFGFIKDYVKIISTSSLDCICEFNVANYVTTFDFCEMSMALENILSNSKKAKAKKLLIKSYLENNETILLFSDDGYGLSPSIDNIDDIFKLGFTTTNGYGIGCYYIKKTFDKISKDIRIKGENGFSILITLK